MRAVTIVLVAIAFICMVGATIVSASAQTTCGSHDKMVAHIATHFSEARVSMGLTGSGHVLEVFASPKGTWTILVTRPNGRTCATASGEGWEMLPEVLPGQPS